MAHNDPTTIMPDAHEILSIAHVGQHHTDPWFLIHHGRTNRVVTADDLRAEGGERLQLQIGDSTLEVSLTMRPSGYLQGTGRVDPQDVVIEEST